MGGDLKEIARRFIAATLFLLLLLCTAGCIHYVPRTQEPESSAQITTQAPVTTQAWEPPVTDAPVTWAETDSAGFPNEPEDGATKRY